MKKELEERIRKLETELRELKSQASKVEGGPYSVYVPEEVRDIFGAVEQKVANYFKDFQYDPESGEITVFGERYVLLRSASVSMEFLKFIKQRYADYGEQEAVSIGNNFLFDNAKVIGKRDALAFHERLDLTKPIEKLSAGPVHFAYTGWANVEIFPESNPVEDESYFLKFQHHNSFEAQSWIKAGEKSDIPVCTMNCGYSAGWCEESFGIPLTTVEVECEAKGDDRCLFIMAPTDKIEEYVEELVDLKSVENFDIPVFFKRKHTEEKLKESLEQKELLIQEIHHRVKNNLQVITSLLRLQLERIDNAELEEQFVSSINRITTMATVHEMMYQSKNFDKIELKSYFKELTESLVQLYAINGDTEVEIDIDIEEREFDLDNSIPLALIVNEITCNAFKHAIDSGGTFFVRLKENSGRYNLTIGDNGQGFEESAIKSGIGLSLIEILSQQIDAQLEIDNSKNGLVYKITFALP